MNIKKIIFIATYLYISSLSGTSYYLETPRTYWKPWTIEDSRAWEIIEQNDIAISYFRRNDFFEKMDVLLMRDARWIEFYNTAYARKGITPPIPPLGFAIFDKSSDELIGTIYLSLSSKKGYFSLSYGLTPQARNQHFGSEIAHAIITHLDTLIGQPILALKSQFSKTQFLDEWFIQGKAETMNLSALLSFFEDTPTLLCGITASVDMYNAPSLAILIKNNMVPTEISCSQYYFTHDTSHQFCFDVSLIYPTPLTLPHPMITKLTSDLLSRNKDTISCVYFSLKNIFSIADNWIYIKLTRAEKEIRRLHYYTVSSISFSDLVPAITRIYYTPICCFVP